MSPVLRSGDSLSRFRVVSPIGAGGMGEVYKAIDESLDRAVALKVLPPQLVKNEERVRRFVLEAKSASSLSHPHIVSIYEIGQAQIHAAEATDGKPVQFIAMELIDGRTIGAEIRDDRVELRRLLEYLAQAADALAKAHAAGIVHRDLKPDNIMVTRDGYAKVLDFGLAKLVEKRGPAEGLTSEKTALREETREGVVVGTVRYMSPEQVQGKPVDHRSDIFSFGALLYEAATRQRPFQADSDVEVMHKILHEKPQPVDEVNPDVPAELRRMIKRCMAKDPERRYQSMKDIAIELGDMVEEWETLSPSRSSGSTTAPSGDVAPIARRRTALFVVAALAVAVVAVVAAVLFTKRFAAAAPGGVPATLNITRVTGTGVARTCAISPDGRTIAYVAWENGTHSLRLRQVSTGSEVQILGPKEFNVYNLLYSHDGEYIYFLEAEQAGPGFSSLYQIPSLGGTPRKLAYDVDSPPALSPDGKQIAFTRGIPQKNEGALVLLRSDGSGERVLAVAKDPERFRNRATAWSPDGRRIAVAAESIAGGYHQRVVVIDAENGAAAALPTRRFDEVDRFTWLPDGSGLLAIATEASSRAVRQLWVLGYPDGASRRITSDLAEYAAVSITADGKTIAATQTMRSSNLWIAPPGATPRRVTTGSGLRVDGLRAGAERVYLSVSGDTDSVWVANLDGTGLKPLLHDGEVNWGVDVPDDERFLLFNSLREGNLAHVFRANPDGTAVTRITAEPIRGFLAEISPGGTAVLYVSADAARLMRIEPDSRVPAVPLAENVAGNGVYSPDGTKIVYPGFLAGADGQLASSTVVITAEGKPVTSFANRYDVWEWSPDGTAIDVVRNTGGAGNVWRRPLDGGEWQKITNFDTGSIRAFSWGREGTLYLGRGDFTGDVVLITGFRDEP